MVSRGGYWDDGGDFIGAFTFFYSSGSAITVSGFRVVLVVTS